MQVVMSLYYVFKDTATTEIYTYCHTLSLHDALPISTVRSTSSSGRRSSPSSAAPRRWWTSTTAGASAACAGTCCASRSEEHTSELQSLMRISYAVFCLKKKHSHNIHYTSF